jgi:hypothetical protein
MTNLETHMYDWVINYNPFTGNWQAAHRDDVNALFNDRSKVIESNEIMTLIEILNKTNGEQAQIDRLLAR